MEKKDLSEEDLGPAFATEEVFTALFGAFGNFSYNAIRPQESYKLVITENIVGSTPQTILQQAITINSVDNGVSDPNKLDLDIKLINTYNSVTQPELSGVVTFTKYTDLSGLAFVDEDIPFLSQEDEPPIFMFELLQRLALGSCYNGGDYPETCHKLTSKSGRWRLQPGTTAQQAQCPTSPSDCYINATQVEFTLVRHAQPEGDSRPKRVHYTFLISPDAPFTSRVLGLCSRALYPTNTNTEVLADVCYSIRDYTFGAP